MPQHKPTIFFSYSHLDRACLDELLKVVKPTLEHSFDIKAWSDREIESGGQWRTEIAAALGAAWVAVLLISNGFLGSSFIRSEELPVLLPRERAGGLRLFTLYVTAVAKPALRIPLPDAEDYDLLGVQAENVPDSPLQGMDATARTALFVNLAEKLHTHLAGQEAPRPNRSPATRVSPRQAAHGPRPECLIRLDAGTVSTGRSRNAP